MDSSHVALVSLNLSMDGFEHYRADSNMVLGVSIANLAKVMKLADNTDSITLQADQEATHFKESSLRTQRLKGPQNST